MQKVISLAGGFVKPYRNNEKVYWNKTIEAEPMTLGEACRKGLVKVK